MFNACETKQKRKTLNSCPYTMSGVGDISVKWAHDLRPLLPSGGELTSYRQMIKYFEWLLNFLFDSLFDMIKI